MARKIQRQQAFSMRLPQDILKAADMVADENDTNRTEIFKRIMRGDTDLQRRVAKKAQELAMIPA